MNWDRVTKLVVINSWNDSYVCAIILYCRWSFSESGTFKIKCV